jgi:DNA polymerase III subunit delta
MQLRHEQLPAHLTRSLAPLYWVHGDEAFFVQTISDTIRQQAKASGFTEREIFYVESGFDWQTLQMHSQNYGLFAEKRLIELRLEATPSEAATQWLKNYAQNPPPENLLLITSNKLDRRSQQSAWFKILDKSGVFIPLWPLAGEKLITWAKQRLHHYGFTAEDEALQCLILATEGHLCATQQAIEKVALYLGSSTQTIVTRETMLQALADNARFDPFKLTDAALQGEKERCLRILLRLQEEGIEPLFILWALSRECRLLATLAFKLARGESLTTLFQQYAIWEPRQSGMQRALKRATLPDWYRLLHGAAEVDKQIKGVTPGPFWHGLQRLSLGLAGVTNG